jgi:hypothetical protein
MSSTQTWSDEDVKLLYAMARISGKPAVDEVAAFMNLKNGAA